MTDDAIIVTREDVWKDPTTYLNRNSPLYAAAHNTECPHGYRLTDSCPMCDYDLENWVG